MNKKVLNEIISDDKFNDNFTLLSADELTKELDKELAKPAPDYDLVDELAKAIIEARSISVEEKETDSELETIKEKAAISKRPFRIPKWTAAVAAACVMLIIANTVTVAAWNMNIVSAIITFTQGGFNVDYNNQQKDEIYLPTSSEDPYGIIAELAKYEIETETPHYLPEGFVLTETTHDVNESYCTDIHFLYNNGNQIISLLYSKYYGERGSVGIPSDHYNISERDVNGTTAIVSKEDNQYTIMYQKGDTEFIMFTQDVPYDECEKIVDSIK